MKPAHFFFLFIAAILGWCAYDHAASVKASLADAAVDAGFNQLGIDKKDRIEIGNTTKRVSSAIKAGVDALSGPQQVSAPAPAVANDSAIYDELRGEIEALKSRVGTLERQPVCTCNKVANAPAPQAAEVPQVIYQDACANGNCSSGRRRGRWAK